MELRRYLYLLRHRLLLVVLVSLAGTGGGYLVAHRTPSYQAQTSIYVGARQAATAADAQATMDRVARTFAAMIRSTQVAADAIQTTQTHRSEAQVNAATTAVVVPNTNLIQISVVDTDPAVAQALADGVARAFIAQVGNLQAGAGAATWPPVSVFARAALPSSPRPNHRNVYMVSGGLSGLILAVGAVLLLDHLDVTVRSSSDLERRLGLPVLGVIPFHRRKAPDPRAAAKARRSSPTSSPAAPPPPLSSGRRRG